MKIKTGDNVTMIVGKDKGKTGKVIQVFPREQKVVVDGLNLLSKHLKNKRAEQKGQKITFSAPVAISNVMLVCPSCGRMTRIGFTVNKDNEGSKKSRICKKCKQTIVF